MGNGFSGENNDILGFSELKWTGMGEFNSHDHYIYYCAPSAVDLRELPGVPLRGEGSCGGGGAGTRTDTQTLAGTHAT